MTYDIFMTVLTCVHVGDKGGKGLPLFNLSLSTHETTFRIVTVKRGAAKPLRCDSEKKSYAPKKSRPRAKSPRVN